MNVDSSDEVFDDSCVKFTQQDVNSMRDYLCNMYPVLRTKCAVHSCGEVLVDNSKKQFYITLYITLGQYHQISLAKV